MTADFKPIPVPPRDEVNCPCGENEGWHRDRAEELENVVGPDAVGTFEMQHEFEYE